MSEVVGAGNGVEKRRHQIVGASAATLATQLIRIVGGLLLVPILLQRLGADRYGFIAFIVSLMTIFVLLESVLTPVLRNELVRAHANRATDRIDELMTVGVSAAITLLGMSLPLLAILSTINWAVVLSVPSALPVTAAVLTGTFVGVLGACTAFADCLYAAWNDLARLRIYEAIATALGFLVVATMAQCGIALPWLIAGLTAPVPLLRVAAWLLFLRTRKIHPHISLSTMLRFFRSHRSASAAFAGTQALACVASLFPLILLNRSYGLVDVSVYTVAQRLIGAPANLVVALFPVFWPQIARGWELREREWLFSILNRASVLLLLGTAAAGLIAYTFGPQFVDVWTKNSIVVSARFIGLFALLCGAQMIQGWFSTVLNALGEFNYQFACYAAFSLGSVVLGALGVRTLGIEGLPLGLTIAVVLCGIAPMMLRSYRRIHRCA